MQNRINLNWQFAFCNGRLTFVMSFAKTCTMHLRRYSTCFWDGVSDTYRRLARQTPSFATP